MKNKKRFPSVFRCGGDFSVLPAAGQTARRRCPVCVCPELLWTLTVTLLYSISCRVFMEPLLGFIGASPNTYDFAASYITWVVVAGGVPATLSISMAHLLRSEGYAKQSSFGLSMGGIINIILDPLFMFVILEPGQEVTGAALAAMLSNILAMIYFAVQFFRLRKSTVLSVSPVYLPQGLRFTGQVLSVGLPSAIATLLASLSNITINNLASGYGDIPVAAFGIVKKIDMLPLNIGMGLAQGMAPGGLQLCLGGLQAHEGRLPLYPHRRYRLCRCEHCRL